MAIVTRLTSGASLPAVCQSPTVLATATVGFGLTAHVVGGGGAVTCAPFLLAAFVGVVTTLTAQRVAGHAYRGAPVAVSLLGVGQFGMHLVLTRHAAIDPSARTVFGLNCGLIVAHAVATVLLAAMLLGACQAADLTVRLMSRARRHVDFRVLLVALPGAEPIVKVWAFVSAWLDDTLRCQQWRYGLAQPRRGPPALVG